MFGDRTRITRKKSKYYTKIRLKSRPEWKTDTNNDVCFEEAPYSDETCFDVFKHSSN